MKQIIDIHSTNENLDRLDLILEPFEQNYDLTNSRENRKFEELKEVAIFLILYSHSWSISKDCEKPDFIINKGLEYIGLEHTRIFNEKIKSVEGRVDDLFLKSKNQLLEEDFDSDFLLNVYIKDGFKPHKKDNSKNIRAICKNIKAFLVEGVLLESEIIERISSEKTNSLLSILPNFNAWWEMPLSDTMINETIKKKEANYECYKSNTELEQWLLIVIHGQHSSYALRHDYKLKLASKFDKIFVLDMAQITVFQLK